MLPVMSPLAVNPQARGLIFDLDGTVADTLPIHYAAWHEAFACFGVSCPQEFLDRLTGVPTGETVLAFNREFGHDLDPVAFARAKELLARERLTQARPIAPVVAVLEQQRGMRPMALATGGVRANVDVVLRAIGLVDAFDAIVTADDSVAHKPSPDIFLEAARRIRVEPALCQVFEDGEAGLQGARLAGMIVTDIRPFLASA